MCEVGCSRPSCGDGYDAGRRPCSKRRSSLVRARCAFHLVAAPRRRRRHCHHSMAASPRLPRRCDQDDPVCRGLVGIPPVAVDVSGHESLHPRYARIGRGAVAGLPTRDPRWQRELQIRVGGGSRRPHARPSDDRDAIVRGIQCRWNDGRGGHRRAARILTRSDVGAEMDR